MQQTITYFTFVLAGSFPDMTSNDKGMPPLIIWLA